MGDEGTVVSLHAAPKGGVPKPSVPCLQLKFHGCEGDLQRDKKHHGGPQRAVCLYSLERLRALREEGHPIEAGWTGENLLLSGLDWSALASGDELRVGSTVLQLTTEAKPCRTIQAAFEKGRFGRIAGHRHPGWSRWYASVLVEGEVSVGDRVQLNRIS